MRIARVVGLLALAIGIGTPVHAQDTTTRVSVGLGGGQANSLSAQADISGDGRYVVFASIASTLVPADTNSLMDVFVHDRESQSTVRVSVRSDGNQALGGISLDPAISASGRFVAFVSGASNLVANDTNVAEDIFVRDLQARTTTRVSVSTAGIQAADDSSEPAISADGRYVAFVSRASNLVSGDTNGAEDIFVHDRSLGTTERVNLTTQGGQTSIGASSAPAISAEGNVVAFASVAPNLVPDDTNGHRDVFVRDRFAGTTTRVSVGPGGLQANGASFFPSISYSGRFIAFLSVATNIDPGGRDGIFVHDRERDASSLVVDPIPEEIPTIPGPPRISGDGFMICFQQRRAESFAEDVLLVDRKTRTTSRVSVTFSNTLPNASTHHCTIDGIGTTVAYESEASNLIPNDSNSASDVFVRTIAPLMALDRTVITFAAVTSGGTIASPPQPQSVGLTQNGGGSVEWRAVPDQPWLQVSPARGFGSAMLSIAVTPAPGIPASGVIEASIALSVGGAANALPPITVRLTLVPSGTTLPPFGVVDTPADHSTGVTGAIAFTGWALDDIEVSRVAICRDAFGSEVAPIDPNCGGAAEIFVGFGVFIDGARPDVAAALPAFPLSTRAGWGFMVLTNMLPNQGNGTYRFTARAVDQEGHMAVVGTRTLTCANATATRPFGTIDTPEQGGVVSGLHTNFGWALTPQPKTVPPDGSTIHVLVDGAFVGTADYNHARPDIQAAFPGLNNTNGAVGVLFLDTMQLSNGPHTISWTVTDNQGVVEGLGSRFFSVSNNKSASKLVAASISLSTGEVDAAPAETSPLVGRPGWDLEAPYGSFATTPSGITLVRSEEINRVEFKLGDGKFAGYLRTAAGLSPLPVGSRLDAATNTFTWAPGAGFVGRYDLVFVRLASGRAVSRREVRIILHPKGRGAVGPQVVIDIPRSNATVNAPFMIGGWAVDLDAPEGTGVTTLHAWAYPTAGGAPVFLGATVYGGARPDVAAVHGDRFKDSGFGLIVQGLPAGDYDLALFAWSTETHGFVAPKVVRVSVNP